MAKRQLGRVDLDDVAVLLYNRNTNSYNKLKNSQIKVQGSYVYVRLTTGGDLVFTDAAKYL